MKILLRTLLIGPLLTVTACSNATEDREITNDVAETSTEVMTTTTPGGDIDDDTIAGEVGRMHGLGCLDEIESCAIQFTVESLDVLDQCDADVAGEQPDGTNLVKAVILVSSQDTYPDHDLTLFPFLADWSVLTPEGIDKETTWSESCAPDWREDEWGKGGMRLGDTERRVIYMDVPTDAVEMRLTYFDHRWVFPAP